MESSTNITLEGNSKYIYSGKKLRDVMNRILGRKKYKKPGKEDGQAQVK